MMYQVTFKDYNGIYNSNIFECSDGASIVRRYVEANCYGSTDITVKELDREPKPGEPVEKIPDSFINREHCRRIAEEIDAWAAGNIYKCSECGEYINIDEAEETETDDGETFYTCPECGEAVNADDLEPCSLYDYFDDVLDIEYTIGSDRSFRGCRLMVACGGPNIYIDTMEKAVTLYWWGDYAKYPLSSDTVAAVDEWAEGFYNCY